MKAVLQECGHGGCWVFISSEDLPATQQFTHGQMLIQTSHPYSFVRDMLDKLSKWGGETKQNVYGHGWEMGFPIEVMRSLLERLHYTVIDFTEFEHEIRCQYKTCKNNPHNPKLCDYTTFWLADCPFHQVKEDL